MSERRQGVNLEAVTVQDCIEMHDYKGLTAVLNDGRVPGFRAEKGPASDGRLAQGQAI